MVAQHYQRQHHPHQRQHPGGGSTFGSRNVLATTKLPTAPTDPKTLANRRKVALQKMHKTPGGALYRKFG